MVDKVEKAGEKGFPLSELEDTDLARALQEREILVDLGEGVLSTGSLAEGLFQSIKKEYQDGFTLAELRDFLSVSRKDALRWAEYFDGRGWTVRRGDRREIRNE
jgi:hypothetical protein